MAHLIDILRYINIYVLVLLQKWYGTVHPVPSNRDPIFHRFLASRPYTTAVFMTLLFIRVSQTGILMFLSHATVFIDVNAVYIQGRKAYTTYRNHTSSQHQLKTGVPQGGIISPTLFNIYTADIPPPRAPVQVMAYADTHPLLVMHQCLQFG